MILERDQVLKKYPFPNWLRVVSRPHGRRNAPPATIPQDIETSMAIEPPLNSADSQGVLLLQSMLYPGAYFQPQGIYVTLARLMVAPPGPPREMINAQHECSLCNHRHKAPLLTYLNRSPQLTGSPSRRANRAFRKRLLLPLTDVKLKQFRYCPSSIQGKVQRVEVLKSFSSSAIYHQR